MRETQTGLHKPEGGTKQRLTKSADNSAPVCFPNCASICLGCRVSCDLPLALAIASLDRVVDGPTIAKLKDKSYRANRVPLFEAVDQTVRASVRHTDAFSGVVQRIAMNRQSLAAKLATGFGLSNMLPDNDLQQMAMLLCRDRWLLEPDE